ncbi:hypothetical protein ACQXVK_13420 [Curtobacterium sp. AB451]|jgi:hypothetical protein|uniref:hypothetical protein n=1 Tax=Curtobacterium sp. AB451 TaxID=3422306 RepID=UPI003D34AB9F
MPEPVVVLVGGWEHQCCGLPVEIGDVVEYGVVSADGARRFAEIRHDTVPNQRDRGRVTELFAVGRDGRVAIDRVPSGRALRGFDDDDDGHLEARWTGQPVTVEWDGDPEFEVVVDPDGERKRQ